MAATKTTGKCLCGSVTLNITTTPDAFSACHCGMCQKWGGGPFLCVEGGTDVKIEGKDYISAYKSSDWAERHFCKKCGTHLYYFLKGAGKHFVSLGILQNKDEFKFGAQIFIDKKNKGYEFSNKTQNMTEAEFKKMFS